MKLQPWNLAWEELRKGNRKGLSQLYQLSIDALFDYGKKITHDENLVEDGIQDVFVHLWNKRTSLPEVKSVKAYLFTSLRNALLKKLERHYNRFSDVEDVSTVVKDSVSIHEQWDGKEEQAVQREDLKKAIEQLPKKQREIIYLVYSCGLSYAEIEEILSVKNQSLRNTMNRAVKQLKILMRSDYLKLMFLLSTWKFLGGLTQEEMVFLNVLWF